MLREAVSVQGSLDLLAPHLGRHRPRAAEHVKRRM